MDLFSSVRQLITSKCFVIDIIVHGASPGRAQLRATFDYFDADGNGVMDEAEFGTVAPELARLSTNHSDLSEKDLAAAFRLIDFDGSGSIEFEEFAQWWFRARCA